MIWSTLYNILYSQTSLIRTKWETVKVVRIKLFGLMNYFCNTCTVKPR